MALPTYLELVNDILVRMREPVVTTVQENILSKLVGRLVNDAKRQVEDAYTWNALSTATALTTTPSVYTYTLTGIYNRFKISDAYNLSQKSELRNISTNQMTKRFLITTPQVGSPNEYSFNGVSATGETKVEVYPVPDAAQSLVFNLYVPQDKLTDDDDTMLVPEEPVLLGAYARALVERGEDGGLQSSEAYALYKSSLADAIAIESSHYIEEETWEAV